MKQLQADALFAATGGADNHGVPDIGETLASIKIPKGFIEGYRPLAPHDVVGMLFLADPRIAERISASQYSLIPDTAESHPDLNKRIKIQSYLQTAGFEHLVLAGLQSARYGTAWVVAYRGREREPFSDEDLEIARYLVPSTLFKFLHERGLKTPDAAAPPARAATGSLVPLDPHRLRIAILEAQGFGASKIAEKIFRAERAVNNLLTDIRERLGVEGRRITLRDLEHYAGTVVSKFA